ncbi:Alpha/Beta hydrolase protein [Aspergillus ambiguus]|uniref:bifunctional fumarylacetoacetate hydrolase/alpha/beta hydrolase family protein n=1 Tax=Aspergillus ambiguus TaxID=176160 RepID=UPI003CCE1BF2
MEHVWGYTIINDMTARERQRDHKQFYIGKSPDTFCPIGPIAVPKAHLPQNLRLQTFVNGEKRQDAPLDQLIFSIPRLIHDLSQAQTLQRGDTLATGTPFGVGFGFRPMKFLKPGDEVRVSVTGLGSLVNRIALPDAENPTVQRIQSASYIPKANERARGSDDIVTVAGKELFYRIQGPQNSPPVIFIHGLGGSSTYFTPILSKLSETHTSHVLDLEGHGLSPTSPLSSLTISSFAQDIQRCYQDRSAGQPAVIVAHSMGCLVAMKLAIEHPQLVSKLILMGPPPSPLPAAASAGTYQRARLVRSKGMASVVEAIIAGGTSARTKEMNPLAVTAIKLSLLSQDPEGYANACVALARSGSQALETSRIQTPTLILTGSEDGISSPEVCRRYSDNISGSQVHILPGVGHWHLFEDMQGTSDTVMSFL